MAGFLIAIMLGMALLYQLQANGVIVLGFCGG